MLQLRRTILLDSGGGFLRVNHYADAVFSEPGRCWRMIDDGEGSGRPFCTEPVIWKGRTKLSGEHGKWIPVWSCDGHREGVEQPERVDHR